MGQNFKKNTVKKDFLAQGFKAGSPKIRSLDKMICVKLILESEFCLSKPRLESLNFAKQNREGLQAKIQIVLAGTILRT